MTVFSTYSCSFEYSYQLYEVGPAITLILEWENCKIEFKWLLKIYTTEN